MKLRNTLALALVWTAAAAASAQVPFGGEFRVNTHTTGDQFRASVATTAQGFVVVWSSRQDAGTLGVFGQRFDTAGVPAGAEFHVNTYTPGQQSYPSVAADASGAFVVAWGSEQDGSGYGIFAQRYDPSGAPNGAEFQVNSHTTFRQWKPSVAAGADGAFVMVWWSDNQDGSSNGVFGQRYDASGARAGSEFRVNSYTPGSQATAAVAADAAGNFVAVWGSDGQDGSSVGIFAQRYDASGSPRGGEFQVHQYATNAQSVPSVASDAGGNFIVAWQSSTLDGNRLDVVARRFDASGAAQGPEFRVNTYTTWHQFAPAVAADPAGTFVVSWEDGYQGYPNYGYSIRAQRFSATGTPRGSEMRVNTFTPQPHRQAAVAAGPAATFVVVWTNFGYYGGSQDGDRAGVFGQRFTGLLPVSPGIDTEPSEDADGNGVLEPGEAPAVKPTWSNFTGFAQSFGGTGLAFTGPAASGVSYTVLDGTATYGTVADGASATCSDCYQVGTTFAGTRPSVHWDATFTERLIPESLGQTRPWPIHVGQSFTDVPKTSLYYRQVETILHKGVTGGCTSGLYCPASVTTREQMAAFVLLAKEGSGYAAPACAPPNVFADVHHTSPFCDVIEELARRGVVGGCAFGLYCPTAAVLREQMPVFVLLTLDPALDPPPCTTPVFADVPASSPYCRWIEELARRGVVSGCGGGLYCPTAPVTREQMAVFVSGTFGLTLYGP